MRASVFIAAGYHLCGCCPPAELFGEVPQSLELSRKALRVSYPECLGNAASLHMHRNDHSEAPPLAWQFHAADPAREDAHRLVINRHVATGELCQARRQLDLCRREMNSILGVEPSSCTVDVIRSIETTG